MRWEEWGTKKTIVMFFDMRSCWCSSFLWLEQPSKISTALSSNGPNRCLKASLFASTYGMKISLSHIPKTSPVTKLFFVVLRAPLSES